MTAKIVRSSKYRHVFGTGSKRESCYEGASVSLDSNDWHLVKANPLFLSVHWDSAGGGAFLVQPLEKTGRLPTAVPLYTGHTGPVLDTDWSPFNDHVVASAGDDGRILVWNVPEGGPTETTSEYAGELKGHERRIVDLTWHPAAEAVLSSASHDMTVRLWDVTKGVAHQTLTGHTDAVLDQSWALVGDKLATTSRDKTVRIFDPRSGTAAVAERKQAHTGVKGIRVQWLGETNQLLTTGFGRSSEREVALWDSRNLETPLTMISVDSASGPLLPFFDPDCGLVYLAGRGDGNIRYYELLSEAPYLFPLSEYKSVDPQRGLALLPKRVVSVNDNEIARFIKVYGSQPILEPLSFKVPRRDSATNFAHDIYPDALSGEPALSASEFFAGKTSCPRRASMEVSFVAPRREMSISSTVLKEEKEEPTTEEALREAWRSLSKENGQLKSDLAQKSIRIRQLEAMLPK
ncbi:Coronin [Paramicrosporidium saccamoebae]|uniref:Coronin n=1 Tax=Paramicrosporidium saccamoebae TaxID=1246581 RepID=A0A2H9THV9_9FUNG|nr:Coronin [Paramicrosporidium saccamoebae]